MEEKIIKSGKTGVKKPIIFIMILTFLIAVGAYLCPFFASDDYETFENHIIYDEHEFVCYGVADTNLINPDDPEWGIFMDEHGVQPSDCQWQGRYLFYYVHFFDVYYPAFFFVGAIIIFICILFAFLTKTKFHITETNIYGKKCFKKFNIARDDIIETTKKGNSIIILTNNSRLKLSPVKNCNKIYHYITFDFSEEPIVEEKQVKKQIKTDVDDITNILD